MQKQFAMEFDRTVNFYVSVLFALIFGALPVSVLRSLTSIYGENGQLVSCEGLRASGALCAGCPALQRNEGASGQLVSIEGVRALRALSAGSPGLHDIEVANGKLVSIEGIVCCVHGVLAAQVGSTSKVRMASWSALKAFRRRVHCVPAAQHCNTS